MVSATQSMSVIERPVQRTQASLAGVSPLAPVPSLRAVHPPLVKRPPLSRQPLGGATKRAFDVIVSALALAVLAPLLIVTAILIKLDSPGPSLFLQRRGGFRARTFLVYKFRTMTSLDDGKALSQAVRNDARVTKLGAILRKTSIDELPQLINVLKGDMSLVGPRPHPVALDKTFAEIAPDYNKRWRARPGITGLAQISGSRGLTDTPELVRERVRLDADYVGNWSLWRDIGIVFGTVRVLLGDRNAY